MEVGGIFQSKNIFDAKGTPSLTRGAFLRGLSLRPPGDPFHSQPSEKHSAPEPAVLSFRNVPGIQVHLDAARLTVVLVPGGAVLHVHSPGEHEGFENAHPSVSS